ncbi:hypothetical protein KP509_26G037300 [Ceratopteris richardii]|uniref:Dof-type domain-containing protein n=1 Tax=Ceratopteris richardii TaxID=49495 RepID=A0A8T2RK30_CERRI|nr:hypothetical protein KP509_26G037300 [Ceratopteris richardii]
MAAAEAKRPTRPHPQQAVKCPRCNSSETKFCYYNNYSTTQPRYFCKNCKRYWTDGGTLRNVPVGGGLRKNKRSKSKLAAASSSSSPPTSSLTQQNLCASIPSLNAAAADTYNFTAPQVSLQNPSCENSHGLSHTPGFLVFSPRFYEGENQTTIGLPGHAPVYQHELSYNHHFLSPPPVVLVDGVKQPDSALVNGADYLNGYTQSKDNEKSSSDGLQAAGFSHSHENNINNYPVNNFVNIHDWQQISEGLFGSTDGNYMFMQAAQPPQWSEFDTGSRP